MSVDSGYKYILAYGILISVLVVISKTRLGYNLIYYGLVLSLFLLIVVESKFIAQSLAPIISSQYIVGDVANAVNAVKG